MILDTQLTLSENTSRITSHCMVYGVEIVDLVIIQGRGQRRLEACLGEETDVIHFDDTIVDTLKDKGVELEEPMNLPLSHERNLLSIKSTI